MKNIQNNSWKKGAGRFIIYPLLLLVTTLFFQYGFAQNDSVSSSGDTSSIPSFITETDTSSVYEAVPVSMVMGMPATTFWTYFAMGAGLIVVVTFAFVSSMSNGKKK